MMKMKNIDKMSRNLDFIFRFKFHFRYNFFFLLIVLHNDQKLERFAKEKFIYLKINKFLYKRRMEQVIAVVIDLEFIQSQLEIIV